MESRHARDTTRGGAGLALDEWFDGRVARPLGRRLGRALHGLGLSANQVTALGALSGLAAGVALAQGGRLAALGSILLVLMLVLDCADGEVARLAGPSVAPWRGRVIDGLADLSTGIAVHVGMLVALSRVGLVWGGHSVPWVALFLFAVLAGASLTWNAGVVDDIKQRLKPRSIDRDLDRYAGQERGIVDRFLFAFLRNYVANIARYTGSARPGGARLYHRAQWVGMTHHYLAIALTGLFVARFPTAFLTYFVFAIVPANAFLLYVLWRERRPSEEPSRRVA